MLYNINPNEFAKAIRRHPKMLVGDPHKGSVNKANHYIQILNPMLEDAVQAWIDGDEIPNFKYGEFSISVIMKRGDCSYLRAFEMMSIYIDNREKGKKLIKSPVAKSLRRAAKPIFTLIAGINGAGKSTYYDMMTSENKQALGPRINADELALEFNSVVEGGKKASRRRKQFLSVNITYHQETTFTGKSIIKNVDSAKNQGYILNLLYIGLDSPEEAIERVKHRVSMGGHYIPERDIIRRYPISLRNLSEQIHKFDNIEIIDNMKQFNTIFKVIDNRIVFTADDLPEWAVNAVEKYKRIGL